MPSASTIELSKDTRDVLIQKMTRHLKSEFDIDIGGFDAAFLLDYIAETMGPYFYNQGLQDAQAIFREKFEVIAEAIYDIEKPLRR
jgi:uncharacterized protein (DUF2164 family)